MVTSPPSPCSGDAAPHVNRTLRDAETGEELVCHEDFWFMDGSVVCRAENTLFRVHMSQLARHSLCFRDMFSLASHGAGEDEMEGCPLIFLHDTAGDLESLLYSIYDGPTFKYGDNGVEDFRVVSGILRLSTKYIIDPLRMKALAHLSIAWPSTLKGWEAREDHARFTEQSLPGQGPVYPSPIDVINLANEVDAPSLLPAAFYDLCRSPFSHIFGSGARSASALSPGDMERLCLGKEAAQNTITTLIQGMGTCQYLKTSANGYNLGHTRKSSRSGICVSFAACRKDFSELVDLATQHYLFDRERGFCDPLYVAEELGQLKSADFSECKPCARSLEAWTASERKKMWKMIPLWFRLPGFAPSVTELSPKLGELIL